MSIIEAVRSKFDVRDYTINPVSDLPETYTCPHRVLVKNQGSKPTCVAHAAASLAEYHYKRQHDNNYRALSTEFIYGTRDPGYYVGDGMCIRDALKTLQKYGDPFKTDCPGNNDVQDAINNVYQNQNTYRELAYPNRISAYYKCNTIEEIKTALVNHGPVLVSMTTYKDSKIVDDYYVSESTEKSGRHCVMIYGYDERGWLVQNSWGTSFAGDGRFLLPIDYKFNEAWGVTDDITSVEVNVKSTNKFINVFYKLYNKIINWWLDLTDKT